MGRDKAWKRRWKWTGNTEGKPEKHLEGRNDRQKEEERQRHEREGIMTVRERKRKVAGWLEFDCEPFSGGWKALGLARYFWRIFGNLGRRSTDMVPVEDFYM